MTRLHHIWRKFVGPGEDKWAVVILLLVLIFAPTGAVLYHRTAINHSYTRSETDVTFPIYLPSGKWECRTDTGAKKGQYATWGVSFRQDINLLPPRDVCHPADPLVLHMVPSR